MEYLEIIKGSADDRLDETCKTILRIPELTARTLVIALPHFRRIPLAGIISSLPVEGDLVVLGYGDKRKVRMDTYYRCFLPDGRQIRINTEVQGNVGRDNTLVNRGLATMSLILIDECRKHIRNQEYGKLTDMCSIWICPNAAEDRIEHAVMAPSDGKSYFADGSYDLMRLCFIFMKKEGSDETLDRSIAGGDRVLEEALSCLWAVFSTQYDQEEKKRILRDRYGLSHFAVEESIKMCTYSQMIRSSSFQEGEVLGEKRGVRKAAIEVYLDGDYPLEKAAAKCSLPVSEFLMLVDIYRKGLF